MDLYATAVIEIGLDPTYFWYELTEIELSALLNKLEAVKKEKFEKLRFLSYMILSTTGVKIDYESFLNLDEKEVEPLSPQQLEKMKDTMSKLIKK